MTVSCFEHGTSSPDVNDALHDRFAVAKTCDTSFSAQSLLAFKDGLILTCSSEFE